MTALLDSGANISAMIDRRAIPDLNRIGITPHQHTVLRTTGHNDAHTGWVDQYVHAEIEIAGRVLGIDLLVGDTGAHDVIIGRRWLSQADGLIDPKNRTVHWRKSFAHWDDDPKRALAELASADVDEKPQRLRPQKSDKTRSWRDYKAASISLVSAVGFKFCAQRTKSTVGVTSIYEIDRLIEDRKAAESDEDPLSRDPEQVRQLIAEKLPSYLNDFKDVFSKAQSDDLPPHRGAADHRIELKEGAAEKLAAAPSPLYGMDREKLELVKDYLMEHLQKGFIEPSDAQFSSPVLFAKKPNGGWRFCVDYRRLNEVTKKDRYPLPLISETLAKLQSAKYFTKLDVRQAFYRLRVREGDEDLTSFRTRFGSYKYKVLPFGLCNGPASFQRYINSLLMEHLDDFCTAYVDDILIYSTNRKDHRKHVRWVLGQLRAAGLQADIKKSEFEVTKTRFLGVIVSTDGIATDPEKTAPIQDWEFPPTLKGLQSFLGLCNFYRQFLPGFGRVARPLQKMTGAGQFSYPPSPTQLQAFEDTKQLVVRGGLLVHFNPYAKTRLETDASDGVAAAVLHQQQESGEWQPVGFYTHALSDEQMNYPIFDKEMLAVMLALKEWSSLLQGLDQPFKILTDHRALEYFTTKRQLNARQARWAELLADFNCKLTYRPGKENLVPDVLSRKADELKTQKAKAEASRQMRLLQDHQIELAPIHAGHESDDDSIRAQPTEAEARGDAHGEPKDETPRWTSFELALQLADANRTGREAEEQAHAREQAALHKAGWAEREGILTRFGKPYVPTELRVDLLHAVHSTKATCHPGITKTLELAGSQYYWPKLKQDVQRFVHACGTCRRAHAPRDRKPGLLHPLPIPERVWQHISADFKAFPKDRKGFDNALVVVDRLSKRAFSLPCYRTATARDAAELYFRHIWRIFGPPESLTSDRGPQFVSKFMAELCRLTGVKQKLSTPYHPQTDGNTEIVNQYIDQRLRPFISHYQDDWSDLLPCVDWAQATLPHESTGLTPYQIELGHEPRRHWDWNWRDHSAAVVNTPTPRDQLSIKDARQYAQRAAEAVQYAQQGLQRAQERQAVQANRHRREVDWQVGDWVYVQQKAADQAGVWQTGRPSRKLDWQAFGPYKIVAQKGHAWEVDLPNAIQAHRIVNPERLRKASRPLPGQVMDPPPPIEVRGEPEWDVEQILASKIDRRGRGGRPKLKYRVAWVGCDPDPVWYPASCFKGSPDKLRAFHDAYLDAAGPPHRLEQWAQAWRDGTEPPDTPDDDLPTAFVVAAAQATEAAWSDVISKLSELEREGSTIFAPRDHISPVSDVTCSSHVSSEHEKPNSAAPSRLASRPFCAGGG